MGDRGRRFNLGSQTKFWIRAIREREQLKQKYTSTEAGLEYQTMNREVRRKRKASKEEWTEEQWKSIERGMMLETIPSRFSPRANSISQQSSKTAAEIS